MKRLTLQGLLILGLTVTDADAKPDYAKHLDRDVAMASVITVTPSGDLDLFGGSVVVPLSRPSVEKCGEHMSQSSDARADARRRVRRNAKDHAIRARFSANERHKYARQASQPLAQCETRFKTRCAEIRREYSVEIRTAAVEAAKQHIDDLAKGPREKETVLGYLEHVLEACPLTE